MPESEMKRILGLTVLVGALIGAAHVVGGLETRHSSHIHPSGQYQLVVYRSGMSLVAMPGQGSDAAGRVSLQDAQGRQLQSMDIDMVQMVDHVQWRDDSVWVMPGVVWPLPSVAHTAPTAP